MSNINERERRQAGTSFNIQEKVSPGVIDALMKNYENPQQAVLELVDNAVDDRVQGKPLQVKVIAERGMLSVINEGGSGLDEEGLARYFTWGDSSKIMRKQIGQFGVGGKAAMGYLARSMEVICSPAGSDVEYRVEDPNWESRPEGTFRDFTAHVGRKSRKADGYFQVRLTGLKKEVIADALIAKLGDVYRPLLTDGSVKMIVNNREVQPLEIKYLRDNPDFQPRRYLIDTRTGHTVDMTVGVLEEEQKGIKSGLRLDYRGRLVKDGQLFDFPSTIPGISRLIGEAHLPFVPVTANKSAFDQGSPEWKYASEKIKQVLAPFIKKLENLPAERSEVEVRDMILAKQVKRDLESVLSQTHLITRDDVPGKSFGRRRPSPSMEPPKPPTGKTRRTPDVKGATPPSLDATVGGEKVRRWGPFHDYQIVSLGDPFNRADIEETEDGRIILNINADYTMFQTAKRAGEQAHELYLADTYILEVCKYATRDKSKEELLTLYSQLLGEYGRFMRGKVRERRSR